MTFLTLAHSGYYDAIHRAFPGAQHTSDALVDIIEKHPTETWRQNHWFPGILYCNHPPFMLHKFASGYHHADQYGDKTIHNLFEIPTDRIHILYLLLDAVYPTNPGTL